MLARERVTHGPNVRRSPSSSPIEDHRGDTYRAVFTVQFTRAMYVLHCFQKKSPSGIRTSLEDVRLVNQRLRAARIDYEERYGKD